MYRNSKHDILEKKIAQLEARLSLADSLEYDAKVNTSLRNLFDIIPIPAFYKDTKGIYQQCNNVFSQTVLGLEKEQIVGKSLYDLANEIPKDKADLYHRKDLELLKKGGKQSYEAKVKCADGVARFYHFYKLTYVVDGKIVGILGLMLDISKYKNTLEDLDKINAVLI